MSKQGNNNKSSDSLLLPKWYVLAPSFFQGIARLFGRPFLRYFTKLKIHGIENMPNDNIPIILAPNHSGELDPILMPMLFDFFSRRSPVYFVSGPKKDFQNSKSFGFRKKLYGGFLFKLNGAYPVKRGMGSYHEALAYHQKLLELGRTLCIYPEGRISKTGSIQDAHGGVAYLAEKSSAHIIPIAISGTWKLALKDILLKKTQIEITIGKAFRYKDLQKNCDFESGNCYKIIAKLIMEKVRENLSKHNE